MAGMRGVDSKQSSMFCLMSPESRVPQDHPLRAIKKMCETVLKELSPTFDAMYSPDGRDSVPPERLLKATILMALYTIRSVSLPRFRGHVVYAASAPSRRSASTSFGVL